MTRYRVLLLLILIPILHACDPQMVFDSYKHVDEGMWGWHDDAVFEVNMEDSLSLHNIDLQLRHTVDYPMSNLYVFLELEGPTGQFVRDTLNIMLAMPDGRWLGRGNGKYRHLALRYRENVRFGQEGTYTFRLQQAMRKEKLPVTEVGLRIERTNPN